jgi:hypothetical protein
VTPHSDKARLSVALRVAALALALAATMLGASSAHAITRDTVLARAQSWVDHPVRYSQAKRHLGYRTDCSGYVSMCWATRTSWSTRSFFTVTHRISVAELQPGDAMLKKGYHIRLFYGWVDEAHTTYVAYESGGGTVAVARLHSLAEDLDFGYVPTRYDRISSSPKSRNFLKNGAFNTWATSWGYGTASPVWWTASGSWWQQPVAQRKDVYRTAHRSLQLTNPDGDPSSFTSISQSARIIPGVRYQLTAWARSATDSSAVELGVRYLNAIDEPVAETTTTGQAWSIDGSSFRRMSLTCTAPPDAVKALVTVRLAGGTATDASGTPIPGTSVILDDITLSRPQVTASITASRASVRNGNTAVLSGTVSPASAAGLQATLYVKRPGASWKRLATLPVRPSGSTAAWRTAYRFTRNMRKGAYQFKTTIPGLPGYLGSTSKTATIRLR